MPEKIVCYSQFSREGVMACHSGPHREASWLVRRQREREELWARVFIVVSMEGTGESR